MGILDRENLEPKNPLENCEYSLVAILDITTGKTVMINDNP